VNYCSLCDSVSLIPDVVVIVVHPLFMFNIKP